jgi:glycerol-3-phosphate dehydrogenase
MTTGKHQKPQSRAHGAVSRSGLVTVTGGKWTTYRAMAEDVLEKCFTRTVAGQAARGNHQRFN